MIIGIMQPYIFPYIGYWQLINAVDTFVIYDDVNYIKQGYINRNAILVNDTKQNFTLNLIGASSNKLINEIKVGNNCKKLLKTIDQNYKKAPYFSDVFVVIENILTYEEKNLANFIGNSLKLLSEYLCIDTRIIYSHEINKDTTLKAQSKVINICQSLKATVYINAIGGQELYSKEIFENDGLELKFLETKLVEYNQYETNFIPYLSIIDIMF